MAHFFTKSSSLRLVELVFERKNLIWVPLIYILEVPGTQKVLFGVPGMTTIRSTSHDTDVSGWWPKMSNFLTSAAH